MVEVVQLQHAGEFQSLEVQPTPRDADPGVPAVVIAQVRHAREIEDRVFARVGKVVDGISGRAALAENDRVDRRGCASAASGRRSRVHIPAATEVDRVPSRRSRLRTRPGGERSGFAARGGVATIRGHVVGGSRLHRERCQEDRGQQSSLQQPFSIHVAFLCVHRIACEQGTYYPRRRGGGIVRVCRWM